MSLEILTFVALVTSIVCAELPHIYKKCYQKQPKFDECLKDAINDALLHGTAPGKAVGLPIIDPLNIPSLTIGSGTGSVGFQQNYKDLNVTRLAAGKCSRVMMDFEKNTLFLECDNPLIEMNFNYEINGRVLVLPVNGKGPGYIGLENLSAKLTFYLEEYEKKEKKHLKVVNHTMEMTLGLIRFRLENLFDGDKTLGDNVNQVMNDNWKEVFADVKSSYEEAFGQIFSSIFSSVLAKVSKLELFGNE